MTAFRLSLCCHIEGKIVPVSVELQQGLLATGRIDYSGAGTVVAEELPNHLPGHFIGWQAGVTCVQGAYRFEADRLDAQLRQGCGRWQEDIHNHGCRPPPPQKIDGAVELWAINAIAVTPKVVISIYAQTLRQLIHTAP